MDSSSHGVFAMVQTHIVIVEDEGIVALQIKKLLEQKRFIVDALFSSGEELLEALGSLSPDLILMDIKLQGSLDGIETARMVRELKPAPIIYLTAYSEGKTVERAKLTEPYGFILKPLNANELFIAIAVALHKYTIDREKDLLVQELKKAHETLEEKVRSRTAELTDANTALRVLLDQRAEDRKNLEETILFNIKSLVLPRIDALRQSGLTAKQTELLSAAQSHLLEITSGFSTRLSSKCVGLTQKELEVAVLVKNGRSTKDIMEILGVSKTTIDSHRNSIRAKLGLNKSRTNLRSYLLSACQ